MAKSKAHAVRISEETHAAIKVLSVLSKKRMSDYVDEVLRKHIEHEMVGVSRLFGFKTEEEE